MGLILLMIAIGGFVAGAVGVGVLTVAMLKRSDAPTGLTIALGILFGTIGGIALGALLGFGAAYLVMP